jgi:hypothetical protein
VVNISNITRSCPNLLCAIMSALYSVLKNFQKFYMSQSNILSNSFIKIYCTP